MQLAVKLRHLQHVFLLAVTALAVAIFAKRCFVRVDDAFIIFRAVENMRDGAGLVFNPGEAVMPVTCPLWALLLVAVGTLFPACPTPDLALFLSIPILLCGSLCAYLLLRDRLQYAAALLPLVMFLAPEITDHVGNEIPLAAMLVMAVLLVYRRGGSKLWLGALIGLSYLTRGEGVLLAGLLFGHQALLARREGTLDWRRLLKSWLPAALGFGIVVLPWMLYHQAQFGTLLPQTFGTKMAQGRSGLWTTFGNDIWRNLYNSWRGETHLWISALFGLPWLLRREPLLVVWVAVHVAAYTLLRVPHYEWYYYPLYVLTGLCVVAAVDALPRLCLAATRSANVLLRAAALLAVGAVSYWVMLGYTGHRQASDLISFLKGPPPGASSQFTCYQIVADWLNHNVDPTDLVASSEIGVIGYYAKRFRFIDPPGIIARGLTAEQIGRWEPILERYEPAYIIVRELAVFEPLRVFQLSNKSLTYRKVFEVDATIEYRSAVYRRMP